MTGPSLHEPLRLSVATRQYRIAALLLMVGTLAAGVLVLGRLTAALQESIFWYYGQAYRADLHEVGTSSLTLGELSAAVLALLGFAYFVVVERMRYRRIHSHRSACSRHNCMQGLARLQLRDRVEIFLRRSLFTSGGMLGYWVFETSYDRYVAGHGFGLGYVDWTSLLPLASIFGLCAIVGMLVAAVSMYGLRLILALEGMLVELRVRFSVRFRFWRRRRSTTHVRTMRERFGYELLSRPPPAVCA